MRVSEIREIPGFCHSPHSSLLPIITPTTLATEIPKVANLSLSKTRVDIQRTLANTTPGEKLLFPGGKGWEGSCWLPWLLDCPLARHTPPPCPDPFFVAALLKKRLCGLCDQHRQ